LAKVGGGDAYFARPIDEITSKLTGSDFKTTHRLREGVPNRRLRA
jgi:hypothetical protein